MLQKKWCILIPTYLLCFLPFSCAPYADPPRPDNVIQSDLGVPPKIDGKELGQDAQATGPLNLTVEEALLLALENNQSLSVERLSPMIQGTFEQEARAAYDPVLAATAAPFVVRAPDENGEFRTTKSYAAAASLTQPLPTGTTVAAEVSNARFPNNFIDDRYQTRLGVNINQALLQGAGLEVNLATIRQARLDTRISEYELRGFTEALVQEIEDTCWDYALALRTIEIVTNALELARQQLAETNERIRVGDLARIESAAAEAELARRQENLINARSRLETTRLALLRLLNPGGESFWDREINLRSIPAVPEIKLDDVETYVAVGLKMRPEMSQARLQIDRDELELVKTRNGLLPRLDLFITLGKSGYAESFGESFANLSADGYDAQAGLRLEYPVFNRGPRARQQRATYTRDQDERAVANLAQLVQVDVRAAYIEVRRTREQITATAATRQFQQEVLRAEMEKSRVGKSTSFLVAQAQRDLLASQIAEVEAVVNHLKSLTRLQRLSGSLLARRGIAAPGN